MNSLHRILLSLLALVPSKGIAYAASTALSNAQSEESTETSEHPLVRKSRLFDDYAVRTTQEEARRKFAGTSFGEEQEQNDAEFDLMIQKMKRDGLIEVNEKEIISKVPSAYGG